MRVTCMRIFVLMVVLLLAGATSARSQQEIDSAGYALTGCRLLASDTLERMFEQSRCADKIKMIFRPKNSAQNCPPRRSNIKENAALVVRYIELRPDRWHEKFLVLAEEALTEDWPCHR